MTNIAIAGASGRMGKNLIEAIKLTKNSVLTTAIEHPSSPFIGMDSGQIAGIGINNIPIINNINNAINNFDVLIDFTNPSSTIKNTKICNYEKKKIIIGTTGFNNKQKIELLNFKKTMPICMASNYSVGVNLCFNLLKITAKTIGEDADIEIIEIHHKHKIDAPSGTALNMGDIIANTLDHNLKKIAIYGRSGQIGIRKKNTINFASIRGGDIIGDHTIMFICEGERIEITHKASTRMSFATGAVRAASWIKNQKNGLYNMQDVLGF